MKPQFAESDHDESLAIRESDRTDAATRESNREDAAICKRNRNDAW